MNSPTGSLAYARFACENLACQKTSTIHAKRIMSLLLCVYCVQCVTLDVNYLLVIIVIIIRDDIANHFPPPACSGRYTVLHEQHPAVGRRLHPARSTVGPALPSPAAPLGEEINNLISNYTISPIHPHALASPALSISVRTTNISSSWQIARGRLHLDQQLGSPSPLPPTCCSLRGESSISHD